MKKKNFKAGDYLADKNIVYDDYNNKKQIGKVSWNNELITISKIYIVQYPDKKNKWNQDDGAFWLEISTKNIKSWICYYSKYFRDFFHDNNYEFLGIIKTKSKNLNSFAFEKSELFKF